MKTRAALFYAQGRPLEVAEIDLAEPRAGEVMVRMESVGLCGSDLHVIRGEWPRPAPMVLGHEGAGVVESVGKGVTGVTPGQRVVLSWAPSCGVCGPCQRGRPAACLRLREAFGKGTLIDGTTGLSVDGETVYRMTAIGALAERVVVSAETALPLADEVGFDEAALLGCAALTGVGAVRNAARITPGATVLIFGGGGVGQFIVQGARLSGARPIIIVDPIAERCSKGLELGATHAIHPDQLDELMTTLLPEGADYGFEAVGRADSEAAALRWTRAGGTAVFVGLPAAGTQLRVDPFDFAAREKTLTGSIYGSEDPARAMPELLTLVKSRQIKLTPLVGPTYSLDDVNDAFAATLAGESRRVLVHPGARVG
jgi:S-(hydroxymethyl)glutathione dehydrogenase / alcohol dehydrogenase